MMGKDLTVEQTSTWALSHPAVQRRVWPGTAVLLREGLCCVLVCTSFSQVALQSKQQCYPGPWCTPAFWNFPRLLRDAGQRLLVSHKWAVNLGVQQKGCDMCSLTSLLKCSASQSQTLELKLLPGPWKAFLWGNVHLLCPLPPYNTLALCVLSLHNLKHSLRGHSASICTHVRGQDVWTLPLTHLPGQ